MTIKLRTYQEEARDAVRADWQTGKSTLLAMATGTGKTETFLSTLAAEHDDGLLTRGLIIAHRRELIHQPARRIGQHWSDQLPTPGIVMAAHDDARADLIVATVQTLASEKRLARVLKAGAFSHAVIDEAHHAPAKTYRTLVSRLRDANPGLRLLGVTATPKRADQDGLSRVFDSVAYRVSIKDAIVRWRCLSPFTAIAVELPVSFAGLKENSEGWEVEKAGEILSAANALEVIVETWKEHASSRPTMAFTYSVAQARMLAAAFVQRGIAAEYAHGETSQAEREAILDRYQSGETQVLVNCMLWTEGFDAPRTSCVIVARPTKADALYVQMVGRGLRLAEGKTDCLILDFAPMDTRDIRLAGDLLGKPRELRKQEAKAKKAGVILSCFAMNSEGDGIDADPDEVQMRVLDYFGGSRLAWTFDGGVASVSVGEREALAVILPQPERLAAAESLKAAGQWQPRYDAWLKLLGGYGLYLVTESRVDLLGIEDDWEGASLAAQDYADANGVEALLKKTHGWRKKAPTKGQLSYLNRLGITERPSSVTRGWASQAITHAKVLATLRRKGLVRDDLVATA